MSSLKWTNKGLQFTKQIVPADVLEDWLEGEGEAYLLAKMEEEARGLFRKRTKAKGEITEEITTALSGETIKLALLSRLVHLPTIIESVAKEIKMIAPELVSEIEMTSMVAIPRYSVQKAYRQYAVDELKNAEELARYPHFGRLYLSRLAEDSENSFFDRAEKKDQVVCEEGIIVEVDQEYYWHLDSVDGHYYYARSSMALDLTKRSDRNKLVKEANAMLEDFQIKLGLLTSDEKHRVAEELR